MLIQTLKEMLIVISYITAILFLLVLCYAIITTPFRVRKQKKAQEELKEFFSEVIDETKEVNKKTKNAKTKKEEK